MSTSEESISLKPNLKGVLETLRDSSILAVCLAVLFTFAGGRDFRSFLFFLAEIWIHTTIIMLLAWQIFPRIVPFIDDQSSGIQWTVFVVTAILISGVGSAFGSFLISALGLERAPFATLWFLSFQISAVMTVVIGINEVAFDRLRGKLEDTQLKLRTEELERERALKLATEARLASLEARAASAFSVQHAELHFVVDSRRSRACGTPGGTDGRAASILFRSTSRWRRRTRSGNEDREGLSGD